MRSEGPIFVDTNVLYYSVDADSGDRHSRAVDVLEGIWAGRNGVVSTQVLSEWALNLRKKLRLDWRRVGWLVEPYLAWIVVAIDPADPLIAMEIARRNDLSFWDALVVRAAGKAGAGVLLTEDMGSGRTIEGILVRNPFRDDPD